MMENKTKIDLKNKSVFITGVAGFIGSNLAKRLLSTVEGVKVVGLDNMNNYYDVRLKEARLKELERFENFSFVKGNLADKAVIKSIFEQYKPEIVVNLGAQAGVRYSITNPDAYVEANLIGFYNILEACRHSYDDGHTPVEHLVYASSSSVYGSNKKVPYSTDDKVDNPVSLYMPLFFLAAGWVYKEKSVLIDIKRRIQTIVVPYFSFGLLVLLYWQVIERRFRNSDMSFMDSLLGLFSGCYDNLDFNVHLWFLPCFFVTVALFNILVNLGGKKIAYIVSALMSLIYVVLPMPELFWGLNRVFKYIGFYALGVALAGQIKAGQVAERKITSGGIAIILIVLNFILAFYGLTRGLMWFVTAMIGVVGVGLMAMLINQNRLLQYLGRISLMVLCIHGPVYRIVVKIVSIPLHMSTDAVRENLLLALIVVAITLAICSIAYEVIIRIAPWMVGKRHNKAKKMSICG